MQETERQGASKTRTGTTEGRERDRQKVTRKLRKRGKGGREDKNCKKRGGEGEKKRDSEREKWITRG